MPSWSPSEREDEEQEAPPAPDAAAAELAAARRLLAELFEAEAGTEDQSTPDRGR